jgi:hypothetical protein
MSSPADASYGDRALAYCDAATGRVPELARRALEALRRSARDEAIGVGRVVFVLCVLLAGMMNSLLADQRFAARVVS